MAAALAVLMTSGPASAQAWIGRMAAGMEQERRERCLSGNPLPPDEIEEARSPAAAAMGDYWRRVAASDAADVRASFHEHRRAQWRSGEQVHRYASLQRLNDPLGRQAGATFVPDPISFVRATDGHSARGIWRVEAEGQPAGTYLADFRRRGRLWRIHAMEMFVGGTQPPEVTQYCSEPGDVDRARARRAEEEARREARRFPNDPKPIIQR